MLKKEEYQKLTNELRNEAKQYQNQRRMKLEKITRLKTMARTKILEALTPILSDYSTKNNVNLIIDKKSVVMGKTELDLTTKVLEELNKKLPKIDLNAQ